MSASDVDKHAMMGKRGGVSGGAAATAARWNKQHLRFCKKVSSSILGGWLETGSPITYGT